MDLTKPVDAAFTKALPKIELHAHLSGSISRQTLHEIWAQKKASDPTLIVEDPLVVLPPGKVNYSLTTFFTLFSKSIYNLINDLPTISLATTSVLTNFLNDGITYLELRTIPRSSPTGPFTKEAYLTTLLTTITQFQASHSPNITIKLILSLDRGHTTPAEADAIVDLAIAHKPVTVGVDIAGNPTKGDVARFGPALAKAKANELGVTVHFAEVESVATEGELETMLGFGPARLGHTDDVGFFCSPVSNEYLLAAEHFNLSRADVLAICRKAVGVIFGGEEEKKRLYRQLDEFEANYRG
ncbi:hypothetical protein BBP40_000060 [Aspergillus hancockii]|nr:hypothetical protein BBP40_000060 [Aspergillus hancockii]